MSLSRRAVLTLPFLMPGPVRVAGPRAVSLDQAVTETMLALGVAPVATTAPALYRRIVMRPVLPPDVVDLGALTEPNLEVMARLRPDLILGVPDGVAEWDRLGGIAPLHPLAIYDGTPGPLRRARAVTIALGALLGREAPAAALLAEAEARIEAAARAVTAFAGQPVLVGGLAGDGRHLWVFGPNSLVDEVLRRLGLVNAWTGETNGWGLLPVGIERLAGRAVTRMIHFDQGGSTRLALQRLSGSAFWNALPFVRAGHVAAIPRRFPSGGPFAAMRLAEAFATHLTGGEVARDG